MNCRSWVPTATCCCTCFPNGWEFLVQILHACYTFLSMLDYKFSFSYLQLWWSYAILSATIQFTPYAQNEPKLAEMHAGIFWHFSQTVGNFSPNFTHLLYVPVYARLQIFIHLSSSVTKLCHIKCDHSACISAGGHFEYIMVVVL